MGQYQIAEDVKSFLLLQAKGEKKALLIFLKNFDEFIFFSFFKMHFTEISQSIWQLLGFFKALDEISKHR